MPQVTPNRGYPFPCYSDVVNFPTQLQALADEVDDDVQDLVDAVVAGSTARPALIFQRSTDLSIPNNADTAIPWVDTPAVPPYWSSGSVITIPNAGIWLLTATASWLANDVGQRRLEIRRLTPFGSTMGLDVRDANVTVGDVFTKNVVSTMVGFSAGTTLELRVRQTGGVAVTMFDARFALTELSQ